MPNAAYLSKLASCSEIHCNSDLESAMSIIKRLQDELELAKRQLDLLWKKNRELERLSITDELTGLYNQRHFHDKLEQAVARSNNHGSSLCLLFFDVDGLKKYNDTYGHLGGNDVLKAVAGSLCENIDRNSDSGYRYGGDEFAVILPGDDSKQAFEIAKKINTTLRETDFCHVTLSFGIAEFISGMDSKTLFMRADDAMYMAKKVSGETGAFTDKVCVYGDKEKFLRRKQDDARD
jgi:diguanylate cyclase (GGDEF)-like protein